MPYRNNVNVIENVNYIIFRKRFTTTISFLIVFLNNSDRKIFDFLRIYEINSIEKKNNEIFVLANEMKGWFLGAMVTGIWETYFLIVWTYFKRLGTQKTKTKIAKKRVNKTLLNQIQSKNISLIIIQNFIGSNLW